MTAPPIFTWSPFGTVFPAGGEPWNGQPVALVPLGTWFTPDVPIDAEEINWCLTVIGNDLAYVMPAVAVGAMSRWNAPAPGVVIADFRWDGYYARWVNISSTGAISASYDGGVTFVSDGFSGTISGNAGPLAIDSSTGQICAMSPQSTSQNVIHYTAGGVGTPYTLLGTFTPIDYLQTINRFNSLWVAVFLGGPAVQCYTSPDGVTWTSQSASLPAAWMAASTSYGTFSAIASAQSPTGLLVGLSGSGGSAGHAGLMWTPDGSTFTLASPTVLSGSYAIAGLHYSETDNLFGMILNSGGTCLLYTTSTPASPSSWTLVHSFQANINCSGLANIGSVWATIAKNVVAAPTTKRRLLVSSNVASAGASCTWTSLPYPVMTDGSSWLVAPLLRTSGGQLLAFNDSEFMSSGVAVAPTPSAPF